MDMFFLFEWLDTSMLADMSKAYSSFGIRQEDQVSFWDGLKETEEWWKSLKKK